jgi:NAD(P)-dependent dehydrogenase (short-subunit alcohol dehydrogenase family)
MPGIQGKVVAITGASSGIGEATALLLAGRGARVVLGARRLDRLQALAGQIADAGGEAAFAAVDVRRREDLSGLVALACERFGRLDVLVSNAGVGLVSPLDDLRVTDWEEMIDTHVNKQVRWGRGRSACGRACHRAHSALTSPAVVSSRGRYSPTRCAVVVSAACTVTFIAARVAPVPSRTGTAAERTPGASSSSASAQPRARTSVSSSRS